MTPHSDLNVRAMHPLPPGWRWARQPDVFSFSGGSQPPKSTFIDSPQDGYVRLVQIRDYYTDSHITYVPDSPRLRKCGERDVMIARYGSNSDDDNNSLGRICRGIEGAFNVALVRADPKYGVNQDFLYYLAQTRYLQQPLKGQATRSVQAGFNKSGLGRILLPLPELEEQRAIAEVLGALDDKIAANDRILGVSDSWTRAEYERVTSEDVRVPLARLIDDVRELVEPSSVDPSTIYIGLEHVPRRRMWLSDSGVAQDVSSAKVRFALGDVLFGKLRPYFHKVVAAPGPGICSSDILVCRPKSSRFAGLTLAALASDFVISVCAAVSTGTRMPRTSARNLADIEVPWTENEMGAADASAAIASLRDHAIRAENESHVLAALRDTLLPQLMSGRLRVKDAEQQVEAVV